MKYQSIINCKNNERNQKNIFLTPIRFYGFLLLVLNYIINRYIYVAMYHVRSDSEIFFNFYYVRVLVTFMFRFKTSTVEDWRQEV